MKLRQSQFHADQMQEYWRWDSNEILIPKNKKYKSEGTVYEVLFHTIFFSHVTTPSNSFPWFSILASNIVFNIPKNEVLISSKHRKLI